MLFQSAAGDGRVAVGAAFAQAALVDSDLFYALGFISVFQEKDPGQNPWEKTPKLVDIKVWQTSSFKAGRRSGLLHRRWFLNKAYCCEDHCYVVYCVVRI
jgi:hypothetical protein